MIVDGRGIANEIIESLTTDRPLTLGVIMGTDAASESFVKMKEKTAARIGIVLKRFSPEQIDDALVCDSVLVQLPLPGSDELIKKISPKKDADALGEHPLVRAPVAGAIEEILLRNSIEVRNKKAMVIGAGRLVGIPAAALLREMGANVTVLTLTEGSVQELQGADIIVSGAGSPHLIKPDMIKKGVVLIDAGTSESNGVVVGDADPACASKCSLFTPVPGGVGPLAVACLFKNVVILAEKTMNK